jgi:hypothetical protein
VCCRRELVLAALVLVTFGARAETVVTACGTDTAGGGTNLASALAAGGEIRIACAAGSNEIKFTAVHSLPAATTIDGGNVTLVGSGNGVMFKLPGAQPLTLRNLSIRNPPSNPADPNIFTGIVYDSNDTAVVELAKVAVSDTRLPFAVRRLVARDSSFIGNGDANNSDFGVVMAGDLVLESVVFRDNLSRPFHALWRGDPVAKNERIAARVIKSTFERNKRPAVWIAGELLVGDSQFIDNGDTVPFVPGGRGSLYGGQGFLELASSAAGALEVVLGHATLSRCTFKGNRGMLGGAVFAWRSGLTLQSSDFTANHAVSGGAVVYLFPKGSNPGMPGMRLSLSHIKMQGNEAAKDAGALLVLGEASGDAVLMSGNKAGESGGALAVVSASVTPAEAVPAELAATLPVPGAQPTTLDLTRTFVLDNTAAGHALDTGSGIVRLGNTLIARNVATAPGGAAIDGQNIELANSTVLANKSEGLRIEVGGAQGVRIANTILAGHPTNCSGALGVLKIEGANLQYPGSGCGASITSADPSLDSRFKPTLTSPARRAGALATCAAHELVAGRDLYGEARGGESCSIGAVEADLMRNLISKVGPEHFPCFLLLILIFLLICIVAGFAWGLLRRRKKAI